MVVCVLEWFDVCVEDCVLDLFCGMGNFMLLLVMCVVSVVGVEGVLVLVEKGCENVICNGLYNVIFFYENLEEDVMKQLWVKNGFDKVLFDFVCVGVIGVM